MSDRHPCPVAGGPVLLDSYAARSCPVKTQNAYDATLVAGTSPAEATRGNPALLEAAARFRAEVAEALVQRCQGQVVDLRLLAADGADAGEQTAATLRAMSAGVPVVLGARLPVDQAGHRVGAPELLVRAGSGRGYHPVVVKGHKILARAGGAGRSAGPEGAADPPAEPPSVPCSTLERPWPAAAERLVGHQLRLGTREADFLQLAHYHRLLQACGFAAERPLAAVVGTDGLLEGPVLAWADLDQPVMRTFSRTAPDRWRLRSLLERYDHEHGFRVLIADRTRWLTRDAARAGAKLDRRPLPVQPIVTRECERCPWWQHCGSQLHPDDLSLRIDKARLDPREIATLRRRGVGTVGELAAADLDRLLPDYLPEVAHRAGAEGRLRLATRRARLLAAGTDFVRETSGPIEVPAAAVEVDLDIESAADGRIYLWGFLVHRRGEAGAGVYRAFSRFADLDDATEAALAAAAFRWLRTLVEGPESVLVYHYSGYEVAQVQALAAREHDPLLDWAAGYAAEHFVDLLEVVKAHWFGVHGLGLKSIAQHAGFAWRDDDPGGLNSQLWFADAVHRDDAAARAAARQRVLEYNEDDVRATAALRAWLRDQ